MASNEDYLSRGLPIRLLDRSWPKWKIDDLRGIIEYYTDATTEGIRKINYFEHLYKLVLEYDLLGPYRKVLLSATPNIHHYSSGRSAEVIEGVPVPRRLRAANRQAFLREGREARLLRANSNPPAFQRERWARQEANNRRKYDRRRQLAAERRQAANQAAPRVRIELRGRPRPIQTVPDSFRVIRAQRIRPLPTQCTVCYDDLTLETRLSRRVTSACTHEPDICKGCLFRFISVTFAKSEMWNQTRCPHGRCREILQWEDMKDWAPEEVFAKCGMFDCSDLGKRLTHSRYDQLAAVAAMDTDPNYRRCPVADCPSVFFFDPDDSYILCDGCNTEICIACNTQSHPGSSCAEQQQLKRETESERLEAQKAEESTTEQYLGGEAKNCPVCKFSGIKNPEGCDHMTCCNCKHEYCWICFVPWAAVRRGNENHRVDCRWHSDNIGAALRPGEVLAFANGA